MSDVPTGQIVGVIVSLVGSAFFSSSETALTSLGLAKAEQIVSSKENGEADALKLWIEKPREVLTTILIGNNIVNVTASALATSISVWALEGVKLDFINPIAVAVGVMTLLLLSFGEITPKTLARTHRETIAVPFMRVLRICYFFFYPATWVFVRMTEFVARLTGSSLDRAGPHVSEEDIEYMVELGGREGSISEDRQALLHSVFNFADTVTREVMVPRTEVTAVPDTITLDELTQIILHAGHSRMPVYEGDIDEIIGVIHVKDLFGIMRTLEKRDEFSVRDVLRDVAFVPETKPIDQLMREMQVLRSHMAVVVDEFGGVEGIVTLEDIIEEFFGEIWDEHDREREADYIKLGPLTFRLDARMSLDEVGELFDIEIPEDDDYDTLGGFISKHTGEVSAIGTHVLKWGLLFKVVESDKKRIRKVRAEWVGIDDVNGDANEGERASG